MASFNINSVCDKYGVDLVEVAKLLYPHVKYPWVAFRRVLRGEAYLDTAQVCLLADYLSVQPGELFEL